MISSLHTLTGIALLSLLISASPVVHQLSARAPTAITGWEYAGCFKDSTDRRALNGNSYFSDIMTVQICANFCTNNNFVIFGVEYGRECFCSNTVGDSGLPAPDTDCSTPCAGKFTDTCGNGDRLNIYKKEGSSIPSTTLSPSPTPSASPFPTTYTFQNCYSEATTGRALADKYTMSDAQTVEKCAASCAGFRYFGLEYYFECFCGNDLKAGSIAVGGAECAFPCNGNAAQTCGGNSRLSIYSFGDNPPPSVPIPTSSTTAPVVTPTPLPGVEALGCFSDSTNSRSLKGAVYVDDAMSIERCAAACTPFNFFGVEYARECFCGNALEGSSEVLAAQCDMKCAGNSAQTCGAGDRLNVYKYVALEVTSSTTSSTSSTVTTTEETSTTTTTTSITTPTLPPRSDNLLINADFESDNIQPWFIGKSTYANGAVVFDSATAPEGTQWFELLQTGVNADIVNILTLAQDVTVIPGATYTVDMLGNIISGDCTITIDLGDLVMYNHPHDAATGWTTLHGETTVLTTSSTTLSFKIWLLCTGSGLQSVGVDLVELRQVIPDESIPVTTTTTSTTTTAEPSSTSLSTTEAPTTTTTESPTPTPAPPNLLQNADFENGFSVWARSSGGSGVAHGYTYDVGAPQGAGYFRAKFTVPDGTSPTVSNYVNIIQWLYVILPERTYSLSLLANVVSGDCRVAGILPTDQYFFTRSAADLGTEWVEINGLVTTTLVSATSGWFTVRVSCVGVGLMEVGIDDIKLTLLPLVIDG